MCVAVCVYNRLVDSRMYPNTQEGYCLNTIIWRLCRIVQCPWWMYKPGGILTLLLDAWNTVGFLSVYSVYTVYRSVYLSISIILLVNLPIVHSVYCYIYCSSIVLSIVYWVCRSFYLHVCSPIYVYPHICLCCFRDFSWMCNFCDCTCEDTSVLPTIKKKKENSVTFQAVVFLH